MPSSTSSSEAKLWRSTWLIVIALCVAILGAWEVYWRTRGFVPSINNDENLWAVERGLAEGSGPDAVILIGSSRMQLGIDPEAFSRGSGWSRPHQLSIAMGPILPILRDLARDPSVTGTIICEIHPMTFFDTKHQLYSVALSHLRRHSTFTPADEAEARLRMLTQSMLVTSLPALFPNQIALAITRARWPSPNHARFDSDRYGESDSKYMDLSETAMRRRARQREAWQGIPARPKQIAYTTNGVNQLIKQVRDRGGDVLFVRLPVDGDVRELEARIMPREQYWDRFAAQVDAVAVHYADHVELAGFEAPDGSHLDRRDIEAFSASLGRILARERAARRGE